MSNNFLYRAYINFLKIDKIKIENNDKQKYQIIGIFDSSLKIWYNAWALYVDKNTIDNYKKSKELLVYALNIESSMPGISIEIKCIIKHILVNSKFYLSERKTQLNLILAVILYLTKAKQYGITRQNNVYIYFIQI
jgi:hypothetical protein